MLSASMYVSSKGPTLNVDGSGLVAGVNLDGDSIVDGQIISGQFYEWVFDNANTHSEASEIDGQQLL